ncbi:MAG: Crp/Fnr family transcriptional regulator [Terriglobia bacterium]
MSRFNVVNALHPESCDKCPLSELEGFKSLPESEREHIKPRHYDKGEVFYGPGDKAERLFILRRGKARIYEISPEGKELTLSILSGCSIFGEMAVVGQGLYDAFAEAVEDSDLCVMRREHVERLILAHPSFALKMIHVVGARLRDVEEQLGDIAFHGVTGRLALLLLKLARDAAVADGPVAIPERFTHQELAGMIGTSRETLTRALSDLRARKLVAVEDKQIHVLDHAGLRSAGVES